MLETKYILYHSLHFGILSIFLTIIFMNRLLFIYILILTGLHFIIDYLKIKITIYVNNHLSIVPFLGDQFLHILLIILFSYMINGMDTYWLKNYLENFRIVNINTIIFIILIITIYLFIIKGGSILIVLLLKLPKELSIKKTQKLKDILKNIIKFKNKVTSEEIAASNCDNNKNDSPKYGTVIGILERLIIVTLIITNNYTAISFVVAIKAIARFKELQENKDDFVQKFIIGTLGSFFIAILAGTFLEFIYSKLFN